MFITKAGINLGVAIMWVLLAVPLLWLGARISYLDDKRKQCLRNLQVQKIIDDVFDERKDIRHEFALYLRSFEIDGKLIIDKSDRLKDPFNIFNLDNYDRLGADTIERVVGDAVWETYPTVAIGLTSFDVSGVGQVELLEQWQKKVKILISHSALVAIIPSVSEGIVWEISTIVDLRMLEKCIFIMPSISFFQDLGRVRNSEKGDCANAWESTQRVLQTRLDIDIPEYKEAGATFRFVGTNRQLKMVELPKELSPRNLASAIKGIIGES